MKSSFPSYNEEDLLRQALIYNQKGDVYNAIKLFKRVTKLAPDWSAPFSFLGRIYKSRREWRPSFYYSQKAIEHNPFDEASWQNLAIAATALKKWEVARGAWNQLGFDFPETNKAIKMNLGVIPIRIHPTTQPEIVWATRIGPARAIIESVPQPSADRRFHDLVLLDVEPSGYRIFQEKRLPVFDELTLLKTSRNWTFIAFLHTSDLMDLHTLDKLCLEAGIGYDNWSKATRMLLAEKKEDLPEYFNEDFFENLEREFYLVALAARTEQEVSKVLEAWQVISLKSFSDLTCVLKW